MQVTAPAKIKFMFTVLHIICTQINSKVYTPSPTCKHHKLVHAEPVADLEGFLWFLQKPPFETRRNPSG